VGGTSQHHSYELQRHYIIVFYLVCNRGETVSLLGGTIVPKKLAALEKHGYSGPSIYSHDLTVVSPMCDTWLVWNTYSSSHDLTGP
jgi:hypothetical protein